MYLPAAFEETDERVLHEFIRAHPLATFVSIDSDDLCANHFPMLLETGDDGKRVLRGHVARANPLWQSLGSGARALAIFHNAGLYVTPSWYPSKQESGRVVPTWNYVAVHASGAVSLLNVCQVAGLGYGRDGSYRYYMSEPVIRNDPKGVGPFILAGIEVSKMLSNANDKEDT